MRVASDGLLATLPVQKSGGGIIRVVAVGGLGGISGALLYCQSGAMVGSMPLWLYAGVVYFGLIGLSAAFVFVYVPRFRQFVELTAISRLFLSLMSLLEPQIATHLTTSPLLNATSVVGTAMVLKYVLRKRRRHRDLSQRRPVGIGRFASGPKPG